MTAPKLIALIPARSGSVRVPGKNVRKLGKHPLLAYAIAAAQESGLFADVFVSTEADEVTQVAIHYGAVAIARPPAFATTVSPDIEWVTHALQSFDCDAFAILRPTSPFRTAATIQRAWAQFLKDRACDSLRAVQKVSEHPGKQWVVRGNRMTPLLDLGPPEQPWHSSQYQSLPEVYVQNSSLEIAWTRTVEQTGTIAGHTVMPFLTEGHEGFSIDYPLDWELAEHLIETGQATLPEIRCVSSYSQR